MDEHRTNHENQTGGQNDRSQDIDLHQDGRIGEVGSSVTRTGIYWILNSRNGRIYIGSSVDIPARWREHKCDLATGRHGNSRLLDDDTGDYEYMVLEYLPDDIDYDLLLLLEQTYINFYRPCYNLARNVFARIPANKSKRWIVMFPNGKEREIFNLNQFCRIHGLYAPNMAKVANGLISQTHGFRCRRPEDALYPYRKKVNTGSQSAGRVLAKRFVMEHPSGHIEEILGLNAFCKIHSLNRDTMRHAISKGTRHKGFRGIRLFDSDIP